jgi:DNA-binding PadR family transcriptional regulator
MGEKNVQLSGRALAVLRFLLDSRSQGQSGADITKGTRTGSGTLYPMLARFEAAGWATSRWEEVDPSEVARPRRRLYWLTAEGQRVARGALAELQLTSPTGDEAWAT